MVVREDSVRPQVLPHSRTGLAIQEGTKHSVNFIPTGTSFAALLYDRHGDSLELRAGQKQVEALMSMICQQAPWIAAGFSKDLERLWKSQKTAFIGAVDERRKDLSKAAAAGAGV
jgi:hypothetical protein